MKYTKVCLPRYMYNREYESPIHEYRTNMGLTIKELAMKAKVHIPDIIALANGMKSPLKENGELCIAAKKLCDFFNVEASDLFPRYICEINRNFKHEVLPYETYGEKLAKSAEDLAAFREMKKALRKACLSRLTQKELEVIVRMFLLNDTLEGTGKHLNIGKERVRQILLKALSKLRRPISGELLRIFHREME